MGYPTAGALAIKGRAGGGRPSVRHNLVAPDRGGSLVACQCLQQRLALLCGFPRRGEQMRAARLPVEEQLAADLCRPVVLALASQTIVSAPCSRRAQRGRDRAVEDRRRGLYSRGVSPAGVHGIDHDILVGPPVPSAG